MSDEPKDESTDFTISQMHECSTDNPGTVAKMMGASRGSASRGSVRSRGSDRKLLLPAAGGQTGSYYFVKHRQAGVRPEVTTL